MYGVPLDLTLERLLTFRNRRGKINGEDMLDCETLQYDTVANIIMLGKIGDWKPLGCILCLDSHYVKKDMYGIPYNEYNDIALMTYYEIICNLLPLSLSLEPENVSLISPDSHETVVLINGEKCIDLVNKFIYESNR